MNLDLEKTLEALLFFKNEPISLKKLASLLSKEETEVKEALGLLEISLKDRGINLLVLNDSYVLGTNKEFSETIENIQKEEMKKDLSKASLETLAIVLYKNGATRGEIDYIRGVNSNFILRNLSIRGLVEKDIDPKDHRRNIYKPTLDLLSFMGLKDLSELPEFESLNKKLEVKEEVEV